MEFNGKCLEFQQGAKLYILEGYFPKIYRICASSDRSVCLYWAATEYDRWDKLALFYEIGGDFGGLLVKTLKNSE